MHECTASRGTFSRLFLGANNLRGREGGDKWGKGKAFIASKEKQNKTNKNTLLWGTLKTSLQFGYVFVGGLFSPSKVLEDPTN